MHCAVCATSQAEESELVLLSHPKFLVGRGAVAAIAWAVAACAAPASPAPEYPHSEAICQYVGLESTETPQRVDTDSVSFLAVYRFREPHTSSSETPLGVKFQVNRSRVQELRSHLESQPEVVCAPEADLHYHVRVKPLPEPTGPEPAPATATSPALGPTAAPPAPATEQPTVK
jgi:hypothetical protein